MSEPEYVLVNESVDEVPATIVQAPTRSRPLRALEFALVPFDAVRRRRRRFMVIALFVLGVGGIAAAVAATRRRHAAQVRRQNSLGVTEEPAEDLELLARAAAD
jgi:hypothetical protein